MVLIFAILFWQLVCAAQTVSRFECSGTSQCSHHEFTCDADLDCIIICNGTDACNQAIFNCPASAHTCNVICTALNDTNTSPTSACTNVTIDASQSIGGSLIINTTHNAQIMNGATIKCPPNGSCDIDCHGNKACYATHIIAHPQTASLSVVASGDDVLKDSHIICPKHLDNAHCSILVYGDYLHMMSCVHIYTENSFNDVHIECDYSTDIHSNCYDTSCYPQMQCNIELISNSTTNWQCVSPAPTIGAVDIELTLHVDSNGDAEVKTTWMSREPGKDPHSDFMDVTVSFVMSHIFWVVLCLVVSICCCVCMWVFCCCYCRFKSNWHSKLPQRSLTSLNVLDYDTYDDGDRATHHDDRDDTDLSDSFGFDTDDEYATMNDNPYRQLTLQQVPSGSLALEFDMRESISIGLEYNKCGLPKIIQNTNHYKIVPMNHDVNGLCELSEGEEDIKDHETERDSLLSPSDDDYGSLEEMYVDKNHQTLRHIPAQDEDEMEDDASVALGLSNASEGNIHRRVSYLDTLQSETHVFGDSLPKLPDTPSSIANAGDREHSVHQSLNIIRETTTDGGPMTTEMDQYPSLPTEVILTH